MLQLTCVNSIVGLDYEGKACVICGGLSVANSLCPDHFLASVEDRVKETIHRFAMFSPSDKIFVAFSGGKDSTVLLSILHKLGYSVSAITVNAYIGCYSKENVENAQKFCDSLGVELHHISFRKEFGYSLCHLKALLAEKGVKLKSCSICGVLRRYLLNKHSRNLGASVITFGHNLNDEAQVVLMNLFKGNPSLSARLGPVTGVQAFEGFVPRVKPLYLVPEEDIVVYSKLSKFPVSYAECPCSVDSFRHSVKEVLDADTRKNVIEAFLKMLPALRERYGGVSIPISCTTCNEPSTQKICKACEYIGLIQ